MGVQLIEGRTHIVIKRDGREEPFNEEKLYKVLLWACEGKETYAGILLEAIEVKIFNKITIGRLLDEVINTSANMITEMAPFWDTVARNLYLQKIYKEVWGIKRSEYPDYKEVIKKGVHHGIYNRDVIASFTDEEIQALNDIIKPERDFDMDYLGLNVFVDKYSLNYSQTKILELPQHGFMRLAVFAFWQEDDRIDRIDLICKRYDDLSQFRYSEATPKWLSSLGYNPQMASCVVSKLPDTSWGINRTISNLGLFSKYGGGLAADVSAIRATGSKIGKSGKSSGPIPFIKMIETTITGYNQLGKRNGACCVTFPWWHFDAPEMIELKEEGGTEDRRARKLQYSIKWNSLLTDRILDNKDITLFDPKDTPELLETWGNEFIDWYEYYETKAGIRKKVIPAVDLAFAIAKQRIESGNLYVLFDENVQNQNNFLDKIYSSNLCVAGDTEIDIKADAEFFRIEIKDLDYYLDKFPNLEVSSFNLETRLNEYKEITDFAETSESAKVMKITDEDSGVSITCTPDHQVWTENRGYVLAKDLVQTDTLRITRKGTYQPGLKIEYLEEEISVYDITVKDNHNFYANNILVHNCQEIMLPTKEVKAGSSKLVKDLSTGKTTIVEEYDPGLIALCNLSSINLMIWKFLSEQEKEEMTYNLLRASDNLIDYAFYPSKEGELFNRNYRAVGVGLTNYARFLADSGLHFGDKDAEFLTSTVTEDVYWYLMKASIRLAGERGRFEWFNKTKYSEGKFAHDLYVSPCDIPLTHDWDSLRQQLLTVGARFATVMAVAPTACQTKVSKIQTSGGIQSLEGIMDIQNIDHTTIEKEGVQGWYNFKEPVEIPTRFGNKDVDKIWYNGKVPTRRIEFDDGNIYEFSLNHKLLVNRDGFEDWVFVANLEEGDDIVETKPI